MIIVDTVAQALQQDNSFKILKLVLSELEARYSIPQKEIIGFAKGTVQQYEPMVPVSIFAADNLGPLEALVKYLKENGFRYRDIAKLLSRNPRAIWNTYHNAAAKNPEKLEERGPFIPAYVFGARQLSVLEHLAAYLKEHEGLSIPEIAKIIKRNYRTVWTAYKRGVEKSAAQ